METQTGLFAEHDTRYIYLCMHDNFFVESAHSIFISLSFAIYIYFFLFRFLGSIFSGNSIKTQQGAIQPESSLVQTEENAASHPLSSTFSQFSFLKKSTHEFVHDGNTAVASNMDSNMMNEKFLSAKKR